MKSLIAALFFLGAFSSAATTSSPVKLASDAGFPMSLVTDGKFVYWADSGDGNDIKAGIKSVPVRGGTEKFLAGGTQPDTVRLAGNILYWTDLQTGDVMSIPTTGGKGSVVASGQATPSGLAIQDNTIFWTNEGSLTASGSVASTTVPGGAPAALASDQNQPQVMIVAADTLFWALAGDGAIWSLKLDGKSTPVSLAPATGAYTLAADDQYLYWADYNGGTVNKMPLAGGAITVLASGCEMPSSVVLDDQYIYWTNLGVNKDTGTVMKVSKNGGTATTLAGGFMAPDTLAIDANNLYFSDGEYIYSLAK